jgi:hypothetical protein
VADPRGSPDRVLQRVVAQTTPGLDHRSTRSVRPTLSSVVGLGHVRVARR